jgi:hypothetical protein
MTALTHLRLRPSKDFDKTEISRGFFGTRNVARHLQNNRKLPYNLWNAGPKLTL